MGLIRSSLLVAFATLLPVVRSDDKAICYSYGVDFIDEGHYFINKELTEKFSSVSYFQGCYSDVSDVLLVEPEGVDSQEYICDQMTTTPDNEYKTSTCPIQKNQMKSGHWLLIVGGNNGDDGQPFAWVRDLYLTVGSPQTSTLTPTLTFSITSTPISTQTSVSVVEDIITIQSLSTATGVAMATKTITPQAITTTSNKVLTRTRTSITKEFSVSTKTITATCTTPGQPGRPDKPCTYTPTKLKLAALATPTTIPKMHRFVRKADRKVDYEWARARIEAAKQRHVEKAQLAELPVAKRAPDVPVVTVTGSPVNTTTTILAPASTTTELVLSSTTVTSTLPPATIYSGPSTSTITLPTPTKTQVSLSFATTTKVITLGATFTKTTTFTPTSSVSACRKTGGHF